MMKPLFWRGGTWVRVFVFAAGVVAVMPGRWGRGLGAEVAPVVEAGQPTPEEVLRLSPVASPAKAEALLAEVTFPGEFEVKIHATPPAVNYPVFVSAAPDGTLYVSSDGNGSLDRKPHLGRVLRVRDRDGDGEADEVRAFVPDVDSPRGLVWDHDRLYLLHPPDVTVYVDRDGDGVVDESRDLVKGIAFTFKDRPADHSSNGLELGVDGWLYAAIGDFGFLEATGTDGRKLQLRGGGVVRFRPDGTGLELYSSGTRNILEVAMSPLLDGFARDNTNDGGGWDTRLHHFTGMDEHGYPTLFKNFADEIVAPLADYGGGSGCGAAWVDEPGIPERWNRAPFTADWGRERVYRHGLKPRGATFDADQLEFCRVPRVTDLDVDARGVMYFLSWKGASFTWVGRDVGFIVRVAPRGYRPEPLPDFENAPAAGLVELLESSSHRRRLEAQRALIRRWEGGRLGEREQEAVLRLAGNGAARLESRVAALFAIKQGRGATAAPVLARLAGDEAIAAWAIRAVADRLDQLAGVTPAPLLAGLSSPDARVRKESVIALGRLGDAGVASMMLRSLGDSDPVVAHTAVRSMVSLRAVEVCLAAVDSGDGPAAVRHGALLALQSMHEPRVVSSLASRLEREGDAARRAGLVRALCRLHFRPGVWTGDSWGTRPDTRGPYYQPVPWSESGAVMSILEGVLAKAGPSEAIELGRELARHRIPSVGMIDRLVDRAGADAAMKPVLAVLLSESDVVPAKAIPSLVEQAEADGTPDAVRAQAVMALAKTADAGAWRAILGGLLRVQKTRTENNLAEKARNAVMNASALGGLVSLLGEEAGRVEGDRSVLAETLLARVASRAGSLPEPRVAAVKLQDEGWGASAGRRVQIIRAMAAAGDASRAVRLVEAISDPDEAVVGAAREAVKRLKIDPAKVVAANVAVKVGSMPVEAVVRAVADQRGDVVRGEQLFVQLACTGCHTVRAGEPLKGPFLGTIAATYRRPELAEAILMPNKTLAQGFVANHFELKDGTEVDGFVVLEAAEEVTIRTIQAQELRIGVGQIARREKVQRSLMPEGLASGLSVLEFASLLDYLESLAKAQ